MQTYLAQQPHSFSQTSFEHLAGCWDRSALICSSVSESIMTRTTLVLLATLHATSALQALVLGGGFAGLYTALNLANGGVKTTLVDERELGGRQAFLSVS